jgi:hypothetical protein
MIFQRIYEQLFAALMSSQVATTGQKAWCLIVKTTKKIHSITNYTEINLITTNCTWKTLFPGTEVVLILMDWCRNI